MNEDTLPPLQPNSTNNRLKREVQRLIPRMQNIEKEINFLRSNVPNNLSQVLEQLNKDVAELSGPPNERPSPISEKDLQKDLGDFETEIIQECTQKLHLNSADLEAKIQSLPTPETSIFETSPADFEQKIQLKRLTTLQNLINQQKNEIESQIISIKNKMDKNDQHKQQNHFTDQLNQYSATLNSTRLEITNLQSQTEELEVILHDYGSLTNINPESNENEPDSTNANEEPPQPIPDFSFEYDLLKEEISEFQNDFAIKLSQAKAEQDSLDEKVKMIKTIGEDLKVATESFETRVIEADNLCNSLLQQVNDLAKKVGDDRNSRLIQSLANQIKSAQNNMQSDISALKERVKKVESLQSLV